MAETRRAKLEITAEDKATDVFDRAAQTMGKSLEELQQRSTLIESLNGQLGKLIESLGGASRAGNDFSKSFKEMADGLQSTISYAKQAYDILVKIRSLAPRPAKPAGAPGGTGAPGTVPEGWFSTAAGAAASGAATYAAGKLGGAAASAAAGGLAGAAWLSGVAIPAVIGGLMGRTILGVKKEDYDIQSRLAGIGPQGSDEQIERLYKLKAEQQRDFDMWAKGWRRPPKFLGDELSDEEMDRVREWRGQQSQETIGEEWERRFPGPLFGRSPIATGKSLRDEQREEALFERHLPLLQIGGSDGLSGMRSFGPGQEGAAGEFWEGQMRAVRQPQRNELPAGQRNLLEGRFRTSGSADPLAQIAALQREMVEEMRGAREDGRLSRKANEDTAKNTKKIAEKPDPVEPATK